MFPDLPTFLNHVLDEGTKVEQHFKAVMNMAHDPPLSLVAALERESNRLFAEFQGFSDGLDMIRQSQVSDSPRLLYCQKVVQDHLHAIGVAWKRLATERKRPPGTAFVGIPPGMPQQPLATPLAAPTVLPPGQETSRAAIRQVFTEILHMAFPADHVPSNRDAASLTFCSHPPASHPLSPSLLTDQMGGQAVSPTPTPFSGILPCPRGRSVFSYWQGYVPIQCLMICITSILGNPHPTPLLLTCSEQLAYPVSCAWVRDLTREGVEPNPGPEEMLMDTSLEHPSDPPSFAHDAEVTADFQASAASHHIPAYGLNLCQVDSTGEWFDKKPLASPALICAIEELSGMPIDHWLISDGLPNPDLPGHIKSFHVFSHRTITPNQLMGKHSVLFSPTPLPFEDASPVFSLRSWCQLFRQVLTEGQQPPTHISIVLVARSTSPSLQLLPLLDKRFELDAIKPWKTGVWVLPDVHLAERDPASGRSVPIAWPSPFPLILHTFSAVRLRGKGALKITPLIHWTSPASSTALETPPESRAHHVVLNAPMEVPSGSHAKRMMSGTRMLMILNCMDPSESSTQLRHCSTLRYPLLWLPTMQRHSPEAIAIAHYHVPAHIIEHLVDDTPLLLDAGVRWSLIGHSPGYLVNHQPSSRKFPGGGRMYKCPADEILDTILNPPAISRLFSSVVALGKWDVYVELQAGVDPQALADTLLSLDNLSLLDAASQALIRPSTSQRVVEPPQLFLICPPTLLLQFALEQVGQFTSISHHQPLERPGHALLTLEHPQAAEILAGCHVPCAGAGSIILTSGSPEKDQNLNAGTGITTGCPHQDRLPLLSTLSRSILSLENVAAAAQVSGNVMCPSPGNPPP